MLTGKPQCRQASGLAGAAVCVGVCVGVAVCTRSAARTALSPRSPRWRVEWPESWSPWPPARRATIEAPPRQCQRATNSMDTCGRTFRFVPCLYLDKFKLIRVNCKAGMADIAPVSGWTLGYPWNMALQKKWFKLLQMTKKTCLQSRQSMRETV